MGPDTYVRARTATKTTQQIPSADVPTGGWRILPPPGVPAQALTPLRGRRSWRCQSISWGGCPRGKVGHSPTQPRSQLRPQFTFSLCTRTVPCPPPRTQTNSTHPLSPVHSLPHAQKPKAPRPVGHRTRSRQRRAARPRTGLRHRPFKERGPLLSQRWPPPALPSSLKLAGLIWERLGCWVAAGEAPVLHCAGSHFPGRSVQTRGSSQKARAAPGQPGSPCPRCRSPVARAEAPTPCWRPGGLAAHTRPEGERQKAGFRRPATQTAASVGCFALPIGKADSTLTAETHRDQQVQAEHSRSAVSIGCAKAFHASRSSDV